MEASDHQDELLKALIAKDTGSMNHKTILAAIVPQLQGVSPSSVKEVRVGKNYFVKSGVDGEYQIVPSIGYYHEFIYLGQLLGAEHLPYDKAVKVLVSDEDRHTLYGEIQVDVRYSGDGGVVTKKCYYILASALPKSV